MSSIKVIQVGIGPLGQKTARFIAERDGVETIAAVDKNPELIGKDLGEVIGGPASGILIHGSLGDAMRGGLQPDAAILTTVSDMLRITPQVEELIAFGLPVVSTCEELSFPWESAPQYAEKIDAVARAAGVAVLGTGVNPGFLMDALPAGLTAVCQRVDRVEVQRYQDARHRRLPFQRKIGAGLNLQAFQAKKEEGALRHVGLTESMQFIARQLEWKLDRTEDIIEPVIAEADLDFGELKVKKGDARGVCQTGNGYVKDEIKIQLLFKAAVGEPESYDRIRIEGSPSIESCIQGGVNGDIATCAITINAVRRVMQAGSGLKTMAEVPMPTYFG